MPELDSSLAVFIDFENLALGFQGRRDRFDIVRVLERLVEKGKIVVKKAYANEHITTFVIVSGDSDFSPLVSKLKENGKHVIGLGMQDSTSELLRDNCDEFIYYEDLGKGPTLTPTLPSGLTDNKRKAFA